MAAADDGESESGETLADANRRKLEWLEEHFKEEIEALEDQVSELEAENQQLRREVAELKDDGGRF